jgi:sugar phosphate isomerase/epimerase
MQTIKGPGIFLAQYIKDKQPFNTLSDLAGWAAKSGFKAVQLPCNHKHIFDLKTAAESQTYCDEINGILAEHGIVISELSTHLEGQLVAVHPAYQHVFSSFISDKLPVDPDASQQWAVTQLKYAASASSKLGLRAHATFSGSLLWPYFYPWPPHNEKMIDIAFNELAKRWLPVLDVFYEHGVDVCYELHPAEDLHDGVTFERFLEKVKHHPSCHILFDPSHMLIQHMDYLGFIDIYHQRIRAFHVKDAEYIASARSGIYGGYQPWLSRPGRFRTPGRGQVNFPAIFSKLTQYNYIGWAVMEWECCIQDAESGAIEGAEYIRRQIIPVGHAAFDDFARSDLHPNDLTKPLGL